MRRQTKHAALPELVLRGVLALGLAAAVTAVTPAAALAEEVDEPILVESNELVPEDQVEPVDEPVVVMAEPAAPVDEPAAPADEPSAPADEPSAPADEPAAPADEPATPADEPVAPADDSAEPVDEPTEPATDPAEEPAVDPVEPADDPVIVDEPVTEPVEEAAPLATTQADEAPQTDPEPDPEPRKGHWVIDKRSGTTERYWVWNDDGSVAKNMLIGPENGAGYYAFARPDGVIVRGKWDSGRGLVYIANNDGRLIGNDVSHSNFVVTSKYDGHLERYYVDFGTKAARSGFYTVPGYGDVFANGKGLIVRGDFRFGGHMWSSDNDGRLRSGWYVTDGFGQGKQRYWFSDVVYGSPHAAVQGRLVTPARDGAPYYAYARPDGSVVRGKWDNGRGYVYIAENNGRLLGSDMTSNGFVVTSLYDGHLERYWVSASLKAARSGFFTVPGYGDVFGVGGQGYIFRGVRKYGGDRVLLADNDGRLPSQAGWVVTSKYTRSTTERYWIEPIWKNYLGAKIGYSTAGYAHYTLETGYVLRNGTISAGDGKTGYRADNNGKATKISLGWITKNGTRYYVRADGREVEVSDAGYAAWLGIQGYSSRTKYIIAIDNSNCRVIIFTGSEGNWEPYADWIASVGTTPEKGGDETFGETFRGTSEVRDKGYMMGQCPYEFYWTEFYINSAALVDNGGDGEGQRFHSILYWDQGMSSVYDGTLGNAVSHGCVRLETENAKWIYKNIPLRTKVWSF